MPLHPPANKTDRVEGPLDALKIEEAKAEEKPYRVVDSGSLYLLVQPSGAKSFEFRYRRGGKLRAIVLGKWPKMGIKKARDERDRQRVQLRSGVDPLDERRITAVEQKARLELAKAAAEARKEVEKLTALTVTAVADAWVADTKVGWTGKHLNQVEQSLRDHVYPNIGSKPIGSVEPAHILDLLQEMLTEGKVESARRVRQRLDAIFEYAGLRHNLPPNPVARAKREISKRVKAARKANPEERFPCVPVAEVPQLLRAMRSYVGTPTTRSLMWFVALTACRTGEARQAKWEEFTLDGDDPHWLIPAQKMKMARAHRIPLAPIVVTLLNDLRKAMGKRAWVFPHPRRDDRPASENAVLHALAAIGYKQRMTGHGFRSLFSTLANGSHAFQAELIEAALAHGDEDAIREAYNRANDAKEHKALSDLYGDDRRRLANWYADQLERLETGATAKVISIKSAA